MPAKKATKKPAAPKQRAIRPPAHSRHGKTKTIVEQRFDEVLRLWVGGLSFNKIAAELFDGSISGDHLNRTIECSDEMLARYNAAKRERASAMVEKAVDWAHAAAQTGEPSGLKVGIDTMFKAASLLDPERFNEKHKLEVTGKDGGAIQVEADLTLTPAEAYERMIGGAK